MQLRYRQMKSFGHARPILPCAQCGDTIFAPEWSEYVDDRRVRHLFACESCGYRFETLVCFPGQPRSAA